VAAQDLLPVALIGSDSNGAITSWNRAATALLGWRAAEVIGRPLSDVLGSDSVPVPSTGPDVTRVRAHVSSASARSVEVDLLVNGATHDFFTTGKYTMALIPLEQSLATVHLASPRIDSWVEVADVISGLGGLVQCVAIGLVGVEAVNRGYSRSTGDAVLREIAARLGSAVGRDGRVARLGGDQFVVVTRVDAELDVSQLVALVSEPVDTQLGSVRVGCYAGSVVGDSVSGRLVLDRADSAMRRAQARGMGSVEYWRAEDAQATSGKLRLSSLLIDAVARREIAVVFQPVIELTTGTILEFESLARWHSSEIGTVDPSAFIEAAEHLGLIHDLGQIVLEKSLDIVATETLAGRWGGQRMSVNVSGAQLTDPDFSARVLEALSGRGLSGETLQLELTGSTVLSNFSAIIPRLVALRRSGIRLALNGFGTGYASMAYLRDLPLDAVKIDSRFVAEVATSSADAAVIRAIISLAGELDLGVSVNGVETPAQHFAVMRLGCLAGGQGFLYSGDRTPPDLYTPVVLPDQAPSNESSGGHDDPASVLAERSLREPAAA
jgi:predicted signal transduction protein with EAL and GGDEF domain